MTKQTRFIPTETCSLHVREGEGGEKSRTITGKPIVFGVRSVDLTPWDCSHAVYEILEPGCITNDLLMRSDVVLNLNHSNKVTDILGRCRNGKGTLALGLNERDVDATCDVAKTAAANDTLELINRGDITGMSFAFEDDCMDSENGVSYERTEEKTADGREVWLRHVKRIVGLYDVSIVTHPAYEQTSVESREQSDAISKAIDAQIAASESKEREAEEAVKREAEEKAQQEAEDAAKREAEEKAKQEAEDAAKREAEEKAKQEAEKKDRELRAKARRLRREFINEEFNSIFY